MKKKLLPITLLAFLGLVAVACTPSNTQSGDSGNNSGNSSDSSGSDSGSQGGGSTLPSDYTPSVTPVSHESSEKTQYQIAFTDQELLADWYVSDGDKNPTIECSPGVVKTLLANKEIVLSSSDTNIIEILNNQKMHPKAAGKVKIVAVYHDAYAVMNVTIKGLQRPATIEGIMKAVVSDFKDTDEYEKDKPYDLYGTVTGIYGNTSIIQEGDYAMYVYNKPVDGMQIGDRMHLTATYTLYKGLVETSAISKYEKDTKPAEVITPKEVSVADFAQLGGADVNRLVTIDNMYSQGESSGAGGFAAQASASGAYRASLVKIGEKESYIFVNKYLDEAVINAINAKLNQAEENAMIIKVTGGHLYKNNDVKDSAGKEMVAVAVTSADQIELRESDLKIAPTALALSSEKEKIALFGSAQIKASFTPKNTTLKGLEWSSSDENIATVSNKGVVTGKGIGEATITATSTAENATNVKATIKVKVVAPDFALELVDGGQYYLGINQEVVGKKVFMTGAMDGTYAATNEAKDQSMLYTAKKVGENQFTLQGSDGKYLGIIKPAGKTFYTVNFQDEPLTWSLDATYKALTANYDNVDRFLGTSNSKTYLTIGVVTAKQAPNNFLIRAYDKNYSDEPEEAKPYLTALKEGDRVVLGLDQENLSKSIYMTGVMSGTYASTAEGRGNGLTYVVEKADDGFYFKGEDGKYLGIVKPEGKTFYTVDFTADKKVAWNLDDASGALCATYDGELRMMGTSNTKTYETIGIIKASAVANNFVIRAYSEFNDSLVEGGKYVIGLYQSKLDKNLFMTGVMSGTYAATAEGKDKGLVYLAEKGENEGEFFLKGSDDKYLGIVKPEGKTFYTVDFTAEKKVAWSLDEATNALCATYDGELRMMGTSNSKTYDTIGIIKGSAAASNFLIRAYQVGYEAPAAPADQITITKTVAELKTEKGWANAGVVNSFSFGDIDVTLTGDSGDTKYYDSGSNLRIYIKKNGGTGSVAFSAKAGYKIVSIKITYVWNKSTGTFTLKNNEVGAVDAASVSYAIGNPGGENEQLRITAFEIVYVAA